MLKKTALLAALATSLWTLPTTAQATTFIGGDEITCSSSSGASAFCVDPGNQATARSSATVGSDVEFGVRIVGVDENPKLFFDFSETGILSITAAGTVARNICCTFFFFENLDNKWNDFTYLSGTEIPVTLTNGVLAFDFRKLDLDESFQSQFQLGAVPEPGTWLLMILGLGAVGFSMRRRRDIADRLQFA